MKYFITAPFLVCNSSWKNVADNKIDRSIETDPIDSALIPGFTLVHGTTKRSSLSDQLQ